MSAFQQPLPDAPPGIDPEVLFNINALFGQPPQSIAPKSEEESSNPASAADGHTDSTKADEVSLSLTSAASEIDSRGTAMSIEAAALSLDEAQSKQNQGKGHDVEEQKDTTQSEPNHTKVIARYTYPSEHRPVPKKLPLPSPASAPSSPSLLDRVSGYFGSLFDSGPAIIEYSNREIKRNTKVRVEAQKVEYRSSNDDDKVVRVMAMVTNGVDPNGNATARPVEIRARHKRVREILINEGVDYIAEEMYKNEIRRAFGRLKGDS